MIAKKRLQVPIVLAIAMSLAPTPVSAVSPAPASAHSPFTSLHSSASATVTFYGELALGWMLTTYFGSWPWPSGTSLTYQWTADGVAIPGATLNQFPLEDPSLVGKVVEVQVTASLPDGSIVQTTSARQLKVASAPEPTIKGIPNVGESLSAGTEGWSEGTTFSYQWFRNYEPVLGASGPTYVVREVDRGTTIYVQVTGSNAGYETLSRQAYDPPGVVYVPNRPIVLGETASDSSLTAQFEPWTWSTRTGEEFSFQWSADGAPIDGATERTLDLSGQWVGKRLSVSVIGVDAHRGPIPVSSHSTGRVAQVATPQVTGTTRVGSSLRVSPGTWTAGTSFAYQWYADGSPISGATSSTFAITTAQSGRLISARVTGSLSGYPTVSRISATTPLRVMRWSTPTISGTAATGHTLYAKAGSWTTGTSFAYQWLANGVAIPDATRSSYKPTPNVAGKRISVRVTGTKSGHTATSKISAVTARVMLTTKPTISGTAVVGSTVKASSGTWTPETRKTYQWYADGRVISGATSSSYKVSAYRKDQRLTVKVTGARDGYATATRTSSPTRYVQHPSTPTISGTLRVGYTLRAVPGSTWSADTSFTYQWYANGTAISGATSSKLTLRSAHKGKSIKVKVRGVKPGYTTVSKISASTTLVR